MLRIRSRDLGVVKMLNIGAGKSLVLEKSIQGGFGGKFICDRMDIVDCHAQAPVIGKCYIASAESMPEIKSAEYDIAFANYVFEHVADLDAAASEVARILKSPGYFITSLPNPCAPEFVLSKYTSTKFHQTIKGRGEGSHAYETHYAYKNIREFVGFFEKYFSTVEIKHWSNTRGYLFRFPVASAVSKVYDWAVNFLKIRFLMGNVCIVFKK